mmetsp:Transcript_44966/g.101800  ORF Transcript_44966/g.101800 Transcript_44966/m.101800 type:complete len:206 (+) Transcript_44966:479-1096(+)
MSRDPARCWQRICPRARGSPLGAGVGGRARGRGPFARSRAHASAPRRGFPRARATRQVPGTAWGRLPQCRGRRRAALAGCRRRCPRRALDVAPRVGRGPDPPETRPSSRNSRAALALHEAGAPGARGRLALCRRCRDAGLRVGQRCNGARARRVWHRKIWGRTGPTTMLPTGPHAGVAGRGWPRGRPCRELELPPAQRCTWAPPG